MNPARLVLIVLFSCLLGSGAAHGQDAPPRSATAATVTDAPGRWIVILKEPPLAAAVKSRDELRTTAAARGARQRILSAQTSVRSVLKSRRLRVTGSTHTLWNAVFVTGTRQEIDGVASMAGVARVLPDRPLRRAGTQAGQLVNAKAAWFQSGGPDKAGLGTKIGIIDSGIDHTHPAFQDNSLPDTQKYCAPADCPYTTKKIIAARSYVDLLAVPGTPLYSRPDDMTPRDRVGHGTAVAALAGGVSHATPHGQFAGVAPKAYLGNYKIFGSPGVNDITFDSVVSQALEDALYDGMDVVTLSLSVPAKFGPEDTAPSDCSDLDNGEFCDPWARVATTAARLGLTIVAAAGNSGDSGLFLRAGNTIESPGAVPEVITVGATTNAHYLYSSVRVGGGSVPDRITDIPGLLGNGPQPADRISAQLADVSQTGDDGRACAPLSFGALNGKFALITAGGCSLRAKVDHAAGAGARAVVFMRGAGDNFVFPPNSVAYTPIPLILIGHDDGVALRDFIRLNPDRQVSIDPALTEYANPWSNMVSYFSSLGPAIGTSAIKPEVVAPGEGMYVPAQNLDPNGDMFSASRYTVAQGASFAVPVVAGAVALSRQSLPRLNQLPVQDRPAALKSSVVNTANPSILDTDLATGNRRPASVAAMGAGRVDAAEAASTLITVAPSTLSFGALSAANFPVTREFVFTNHGNAPARIFLRADRWTPDDRTQLVFTPGSSLVIQPGAKSQPVQIRLQGSAPVPGRYEGAVTVEGAGARFQIPFLYSVTDGIPASIVPLENYDFVGQADNRLRGGLSFKVLDRFGVPVSNVPVAWSVVSGGGQIVGIYSPGGRVVTDQLGISEAYEVHLGPNAGTQVIQAKVDSLNDPIQFVGRVRAVPTIDAGGVVNAASGVEGAGLAPGSIISIHGVGLSEFNMGAAGPSLPMSLGGISVSFDNSDRGMGYPGRIVSVNQSRVDVQIPWEFAGVPSADIKVALDGFTNTAPFTITLAAADPAFWTRSDPDSGQTIAQAWDDTGAEIRSGNGARKGSIITLRANGLGPVQNQPQSGEPPADGAQTNPLREIGVSFDGVQAELISATLQAGVAGSYVVRVRVPQGIPAGNSSSQMTIRSGETVSAVSVKIPIAQ